VVSYFNSKGSNKATGQHYVNDRLPHPRVVSYFNSTAATDNYAATFLVNFFTVYPG